MIFDLSSSHRSHSWIFNNYIPCWSQRSLRPPQPLRPPPPSRPPAGRPRWPLPRPRRPSSPWPAPSGWRSCNVYRKLGLIFRDCTDMLHMATLWNLGQACVTCYNAMNTRLKSYDIIIHRNQWTELVAVSHSVLNFRIVSYQPTCQYYSILFLMELTMAKVSFLSSGDFKYVCFLPGLLLGELRPPLRLLQLLLGLLLIPAFLFGLGSADPPLSGKLLAMKILQNQVQLDQIFTKFCLDQPFNFPLQNDSWTESVSEVVPADSGDVLLGADVPLLLRQDIHREDSDDVFTSFWSFPGSNAFVLFTFSDKGRVDGICIWNFKYNRPIIDIEYTLKGKSLS